MILIAYIAKNTIKIIGLFVTDNIKTDKNISDSEDDVKYNE